MICILIGLKSAVRSYNLFFEQTHYFYNELFIFETCTCNLNIKRWIKWLIYKGSSSRFWNYAIHGVCYSHYSTKSGVTFWRSQQSVVPLKLTMKPFLLLLKQYDHHAVEYIKFHLIVIVIRCNGRNMCKEWNRTKYIKNR